MSTPKLICGHFSGKEMKWCLNIDFFFLAAEPRTNCKTYQHWPICCLRSSVLCGNVKWKQPIFVYEDVHIHSLLHLLSLNNMGVQEGNKLPNWNDDVTVGTRVFKFGSETTTVWFLPCYISVNSLLLLYVLKYQSWDVCVLNSFISFLLLNK